MPRKPSNKKFIALYNKTAGVTDDEFSDVALGSSTIAHALHSDRDNVLKGMGLTGGNGIGGGVEDPEHMAVAVTAAVMGVISSKSDDPDVAAKNAGRIAAKFMSEGLREGVNKSKYQDKSGDAAVSTYKFVHGDENFKEKIKIGRIDKSDIKNEDKASKLFSHLRAGDDSMSDILLATATMAYALNENKEALRTGVGYKTGNRIGGEIDDPELLSLASAAAIQAVISNNSNNSDDIVREAGRNTAILTAKSLRNDINKEQYFNEAGQRSLRAYKYAMGGRVNSDDSTQMNRDMPDDMPIRERWVNQAEVEMGKLPNGRLANQREVIGYIGEEWVEQDKVRMGLTPDGELANQKAVKGYLTNEPEPIMPPSVISPSFGGNKRPKPPGFMPRMPGQRRRR